MSTINFAGNLAADPVLRETPNGNFVASFTVIENQRRQTANGWENAEPNAFRVEVWQQQAKNAAASLHTGERVHIEGRIVTKRWVDKDTQEPRTAQYVIADEVSVSLRFHTAVATKNPSTAPVSEETPITGWAVAQIPGDETPY